jgi:NADH-quinone oxidoreductase subunit G
MPALNQQEGTFTSLNKKVVPTNAAVSYGGYILNDLVSSLGFGEKLTIDYTPKLPRAKGFMMAYFDSLPNLYNNAGDEVRGYDLKVKTSKASDEIEALSKIKALKSDLIYLSNPINQVNEFTNKTHQLKEEIALYISPEILESGKFADGDEVEVKTNSGEVKLKVTLDKQLRGDIPYVATFDKSVDTKSLFGDGYRFTTATIRKV